MRKIQEKSRILTMLLILGSTLLALFGSTVQAADEAEKQALLEYLNSVPGMEAQVLSNTKYPDYLAIEIKYRQPLNHRDPNGDQFTQDMVLMHKSKEIPMLLSTKGYDSWPFAHLSELSADKGMNELIVEHRYFGHSKPQDPQWRYLTIENAADDMHRIVSAIRPFYDHKSKWLSFGASKGGMTASYYKAFYPHDVDATLAYVAPMSFGRKDARYAEFLQQVGDDECRNTVKAYQRMMLFERDTIKTYVEDLSWWSWGFTHMGFDKAYDKAVAEFLFKFYQYDEAADCDKLPTEQSDTFTKFYPIAADLLSFSDFGFEFYEGYYYQAYTQLGYPLLPTDHISDLLVSDPNNYLDYLSQPPQRDHFDPIMRRINAQIHAKANHTIYIYGERDPWSTGQFMPRMGPRVENYKFIVKDGNHSASLYQLPSDEKAVAEDALARWLNWPAMRASSTSAAKMLRPVDTHEQQGLIDRLPLDIDMTDEAVVETTIQQAIENIKRKKHF